MELKEAYKEALKAEVQPLIDAGKITLLGTVEDLAEDLTNAVFAGLKKGAELSDPSWDNIVVIPAVDFLKEKVAPYIDKIDGAEKA